jgi:hypothetical protein
VGTLLQEITQFFSAKNNRDSSSWNNNLKFETKLKKHSINVGQKNGGKISDEGKSQTLTKFNAKIVMQIILAIRIENLSENNRTSCRLHKTWKKKIHHLSSLNIVVKSEATFGNGL